MTSPVEAAAVARSNGYDAVAERFMAGRLSSGVGAATVRDWARRLTPGGAVVDLGCGHGVPISQALIEAGLAVHGVDASPRMTAAFRERFPDSPVALEAVEDSHFFDRTFDAAVAWGLMFLLPVDAQLALIKRVSAALRFGGRFLFTAPEQVCTWSDTLTGRPSISLGGLGYRAALSAAGLAVVGEYQDEGENHYFDAERR